MKGARAWVALTLVLAVVFHVVGVWAMSRAIMEISLYMTSPANHIIYREPVTAAQLGRSPSLAPALVGSQSMSCCS